MTQTEIAIEVFTLGEGENTGSGDHTIIMNDQSAIVQNGFRMKDG